MKKILIVVDMQNDFVSGALGSAEAKKIVDKVIKKISEYPKEAVFATRDTHYENYLQTQEGKNLPITHCIKGTNGWHIISKISVLLDEAHIVDKETFGSIALAKLLVEKFQNEELAIELVGLCTDICVVSNAMLLKAFMPEAKISVDSSCCAGVTVASHKTALDTMKACQVQVI